MVVASSTGTKLEEYSYGAWGRRRNHTNWDYSGATVPTFITRGYTSHEHIEEVGLINMNGRVYDPLIGLFLSPDPFVQYTGEALNYNRYSYVMNNPLKYTDPSGYYLELAYAEEARRQANKSDITGKSGGSLFGAWYFNGSYSGSRGNWQANYSEFTGADYRAMREGVSLLSRTEYGGTYSKETGVRSFSTLQESIRFAHEMHAGSDEKVGKIVNTVFTGTRKNPYSNIVGYHIINPNGHLQYITFNQYLRRISSLSLNLYNSTLFGTGMEAQSQGGMNSANTRSPDWVNTTGTILGASGTARGTKMAILDFAAQSDESIKNLKYYKGVKTVGRYAGGASVLITGAEVLYESEFRASHALDVTMTGLSFIPGFGWAIGGGYFVTNLIVNYTTGMDIGEHLDSRLNGGVISDW